MLYIRNMFALAAAIAVSSATASLERLENALSSGGEPVPSRFVVVSPESELEVRLGGARVVPAMGLASSFWVEGGEDAGRGRGEFLALEGELAELERDASSRGLTVEGRARRWQGSQPQVYELLVSGAGPREALAESFGRLNERLRALRRARGLQARGTKVAPLEDEGAFARALGLPGRRADGAWRSGGGSGLIVAAAFLASSSCLVTADLPATRLEALRPLLAAGFSLEGPHAHGARSVLHAWAIGEPLALARALRSAMSVELEKDAGREGQSRPARESSSGVRRRP